jgi:hypothetical protein
VPESGIVGDIGDEHCLPGLERALELGIPGQIHHIVADARILVARHQAHRVAAALREEDRAAVQPERLAQAAGDRLDHVREVQRARDLLEDLHDREKVPLLLLECLDARLEPLDVVGGGSCDGHESRPVREILT